MARYVVSGPALRELDIIWRWTAEKWSIDQAERLNQQFHERFQFLTGNSFAGIARPEYDPDIRSFVVRSTPFIIFYYPRDYGVEIVHIHHASQDLTTLFDQ